MTTDYITESAERALIVKKVGGLCMEAEMDLKGEGLICTKALARGELVYPNSGCQCGSWCKYKNDETWPTARASPLPPGEVSRILRVMAQNPLLSDGDRLALESNAKEVLRESWMGKNAYESSKWTLGLRTAT